MRYLIILLLLTGCSTTLLPPAPKPQAYDMVTFCKTYGGVKHCERVTREEAKALTWREYSRMLNRMGRF